MISRRTFLVASAGAAAGLLVAACGSSGDSASDDAQSGDSAAGGTDVAQGGPPPAQHELSPDGYDIVRRFPTSTLVPGTLRMPISLAVAGQLLTDPSDGPEELTGWIVDDAGTIVADGLTATKRSEGLPNAYWSFTAELSEPGLYTLFIDGGTPDGSALEVNDPATVAIPLVGQPLPPFDTPTVSDHAGVDPICTHDPECPLHDITLTDALATGKPVAYLIGTPAYCQTGVCGPILDLLLELRQDEFSDDVVFVHADVYTDETLKEVAPAVNAYQLDFEPVLFVTDAAGVLSTRLDAVFDKSEMRDALTRVATTS